MLQLRSENLNIIQLAGIFAKYPGIRTKISDNSSSDDGNVKKEHLLDIDGNIQDELLSDIIDNVDIKHLQNFTGETLTSPKVFSNTCIEQNAEKLETKKTIETPKVDVVEEGTQEEVHISCYTKDYDLLFPTVERGQVYLCDLGEPYGNEQGFVRPIIIIQNDIGNRNSPTTIILPITSQVKTKLPVHFEFTFSSENMLDYDENRIPNKANIALAEHIRVIDKRRLLHYIGQMSPKFMDDLQAVIDESLHLTNRVITKVQQVVKYLNKPVYISEPKHVKNSSQNTEPKTLNTKQIQLLALVNIDELFKIANRFTTDEVKAKSILELFGFDLTKNGVQYLLQAILVSPKNSYFNLETLCDLVAKKEKNIEKDEVKRLIVARVKEVLKFKDSPTIDFIRIANCFLSKKEEEENENNL